MFTCGPNEVMVVSGMCLSEPRYVIGGRVFVWPKIQQVQFMSLNTINLEIITKHVYTKLGVPVNVVGVANVKIEANNEDMLKSASTIFLSKSESQVHDIALSTVEGHQRAIIGELTVEEIYLDRNKFNDKVLEVSAADLIAMGLTIVSYTIKSMSDDMGYLDAIGLGRIEQVKRDARIGEAEAHMQSNIKVMESIQMNRLSEFHNNTEMARAKREYQLQQAGFDMEVNTNKAKADMAYKLQAAKTQQAIRLEEMEIKVVERAQAAQIMQQETARREMELEATVRRPAEAEKYRIIKTAEAERQKLTLEAQARAEARKLEGEAEAFAVEAKGKAEAEQMHKKALAYKYYDNAARVNMVLEKLPQINAEVSANLNKSDAKITVLSTGNQAVGATRITEDVMEIVERLPKLVADMSGIDINKNN